MACMAVIVGFQLVAFAFFTKVFAIAEGLLPDDPKLSRVFKFFNLEKGILLGLAVLLAGILFLLRAVWIWRQARFRRARLRTKSAPPDSGGHAHRAGRPGRFLQLLHERAGSENPNPQTAATLMNQQTATWRDWLERLIPNSNICPR